MAEVNHDALRMLYASGPLAVRLGWECVVVLRDPAMTMGEALRIIADVRADRGVSMVEITTAPDALEVWAPKRPTLAAA